MMKEVKTVSFYSMRDLAESITEAEGVYMRSIEGAEGTIARKNEFMATYLFNTQGAAIRKGK